MKHASPGYRNPPIDEGFCQLTWASPLDWNIATPGLLYEKLRSEYPATPEQQAQMQASFEVPAPGATAHAGFSMEQGPLRVVYRDDTGSRVLVADARSFSVNSLRPYEGWVRLRERLAQGVEAVGAVSAPSAVQAVSLRYLNRIAVPGFPIDTDDYFTAQVRAAQAASPGNLRGFLSRTQTSFDDLGVIASITFASLDGGPDEEGHFLLDIEFAYSGAGMSTSEALDKADELKRLENSEFESFITDKTRELFK